MALFLHPHFAGVIASVVLAVGTVVHGAESASSVPRAVTDFPGASPRAVNVDQSGKVSFTVTSEAGWAVWWYFALENIAPGQTVRLESRTIPSPVVSEDGKAWRYFELGKPVTLASPKAWFAWYVPYVLADAEALTQRLMQTDPEIRREELCRSEGGFPVPFLRFGGRSAQPKPVVWIQARQHAWEVGSSWTAQGIALWAASEDPLAKQLRAKVELIIVPIMDIDNVQRGNGGKDQKPHDHNRDWSDAPVWASVKAAQGRLDALIAEKRLRLFIDLHDPGYNDPGVEWWISSLEELTPVTLSETQRLASLYRTEMVSTYGFKGFHETGKGYGGGTSSGAWVRARSKGVVVSGTLEIPVGPPKGFNQPPPNQHLLLGAGIGRSIARWLDPQSLPP